MLITGSKTSWYLAARSSDRVDWNGNNRQKVSDQERVQDVSIIGDRVYFHVNQGHTWPLYRIEIDGTEEKKIEVGRTGYCRLL